MEDTKSRIPVGRRWSAADLAAVAMLTSIVAFPRSFILLKMTCLFLYISIEGISRKERRNPGIYSAILAYYWVTIAIGLIWAGIGFHYGNSTIAIYDHIRLYVAWSIVYGGLFCLLRSGDRRDALHAAFVLASIIIFLINAAGLAEGFLGVDFLSDDLKQSLRMDIGIHEGYVQVTSHNIGSLFFVVPYLLAIAVRVHRPAVLRRTTWFALFVSLAISAASGRRALWIVIALCPALILLVATLSGTIRTLRPHAIRLFWIYIIAVVAFAVLALHSEYEIVDTAIGHLADAFSETDERSIQRDYLLHRFSEFVFLGSGPGGIAEYTRSDEAPWVYELTYVQMLFNFGIIGTTVIVAVFVFFAIKGIRVVKSVANPAGLEFATIVGVLAFLLGTYSNPYLGSFDFLLYIGMLPFIASYDQRAR